MREPVNGREVLATLKAQHMAIDCLMARLILLNPEFRPTQSGPIWKAVTDGHKLIHQLEHLFPASSASDV